MSRDPKRCPRPDDVFRRGRMVRRVTYLAQDSLGLIRVVGMLEGDRLVKPNLYQFRKWAADAEVIHHAD